MFKNLNGTCTQIGADIDGETDNDQSGISVSFSSSGTTLAIGAVFNNGWGTQRGQMRVYKYLNSTWTQIGADIDGEANGDLSGRSVSLSADGFTLAIGAPFNDGGGSDRGQVRLYSYYSQTQKFLNAILAMAKQKGKKIYVCHQGVYNLQVGEPDLYFHLYHGDKLRKCNVNYCEGLEFRGDDLMNFIGTETDQFTAENMVLYPNPASHILNVKWPFYTGQAIQIQVYNSLGQSMINQSFYFSGKDHQDIRVNIQKLLPGFYILKATWKGFEASRPFSKL